MKTFKEHIEDQEFQLFVEDVLDEDFAMKVFDKIANAEKLIKSGWRYLKNKYRKADDRSFNQKMEEYFQKWDKRDEAIQNLLKTVKLPDKDSVLQSTVKIIQKANKDILPHEDKTIDLKYHQSEIKSQIMQIIETIRTLPIKSDDGITLKLMHLYLLVIGLLNKDRKSYIDFQ